MTMRKIGAVFLGAALAVTPGLASAAMDAPAANPAPKVAPTPKKRTQTPHRHAVRHAPAKQAGTKSATTSD